MHTNKSTKDQKPITYEIATQTLATLARYVPIREITKLYIWQPNTKHDKQLPHQHKVY